MARQTAGNLMVDWLEMGAMGIRESQTTLAPLTPDPVQNPGESTADYLERQGVTGQYEPNINDPVGWTFVKRTSVLFLICFAGFLADFTSAAGVPLVHVQSLEWGASAQKILDASSINVAMLGIGGVFWGWASGVVGRLPVLFWSVLLGLATMAAATFTTNFPIYYIVRVLSGFFLSSYQVVGMAVIRDMYLPQERATRIGIWVSSYLLSPYLSPLLAYFILSDTQTPNLHDGNWRVAMGSVTAIVLLCFLCIIAFGRETWYDSNKEQPLREIPLSRIKHLTGIWQIRNQSYFISPVAAAKRLWRVFYQAPVILMLFSYMLYFSWAIGINITSSQLFLQPRPSGIGATYRHVGFMYLAPVIGVVQGLIISHFAMKLLALRHLYEHRLGYLAENRLITGGAAALLTLPSLIMIGFAIDYAGDNPKAAQWILIGGWIVYVTGATIASSSITAYLLDAYPLCAAETSAILNLARSLGGFWLGFIQEHWGRKQTYKVSFGTQGALTVVASLLCFITFKYGQKMRGSPDYDHMVVFPRNDPRNRWNRQSNPIPRLPRELSAGNLHGPPLSDTTRPSGSHDRSEIEFHTTITGGIDSRVI